MYVTDRTTICSLLSNKRHNKYPDLRKCAARGIYAQQMEYGVYNIPQKEQEGRGNIPPEYTHCFYELLTRTWPWYVCQDNDWLLSLSCCVRVNNPWEDRVPARSSLAFWVKRNPTHGIYPQCSSSILDPPDSPLPHRPVYHPHLYIYSITYLLTFLVNLPIATGGQLPAVKHHPELHTYLTINRCHSLFPLNRCGILQVSLHNIYSPRYYSDHDR